MRKFVLIICALIAIGRPLLADEPTRCAQEELRKRNLYFGDVDGRMSEEFRGALKRYQARKNLEVTGKIDEETASSLNVPVAIAEKSPPERWPDLPVLKSDVARELPEKERLALEQKAEWDAEAANSPAPPAESPPALPNFMPERVTKFVEDYLRDAEGGDVELQVGYYGFPVEYFDHGPVDRKFVTRDTRNYVIRWPKRRYILMTPVTLTATRGEDEAQVQFKIDFTVKNSKNTVTGRTKNDWTIKAENDHNLIIVAIREQRTHD